MHRQEQAEHVSSVVDGQSMTHVFVGQHAAKQAAHDRMDVHENLNDLLRGYLQERL